MSFLSKHYPKIVIFGIAGACIVAAGIVMISSRIQYEAYLNQYEINVEKIKASFPSLPEKVFFDNDYVTYNGEGDDISATDSSFKNAMILYARDAEVAPLSESKAQEYKTIKGDDSTLNEYITGLDRMGGAITFTINTENYGMSDIEICLRNNWVDGSGVYHEIENLTDKIKIQVTRLELKTEDLSLGVERDGFQSLIFKNTFLMKGENTITFATSAINDLDNMKTVQFIMPDIRNLTVLTDVDLIPPVRDVA